MLYFKCLKQKGLFEKLGIFRKGQIIRKDEAQSYQGLIRNAFLRNGSQLPKKKANEFYAAHSF